jgi:two-component system CheB/CheR fusion protein
MDLPLQKKLLSVFHYALKPHGFLALGQAETVGAQATCSR